MPFKLLGQAAVAAAIFLSMSCLVVQTPTDAPDDAKTNKEPYVAPAVSPYGAWTLEAPESIVSGASELFILYPNGHYFQWSSHEEAGRPNAELGTVAYEAGILSGFQHVQNGSGGFDDDTGENPYGGSLTLNLTEKTLIMQEPQLTWHRVTSSTNPLVGAWDFDNLGHDHVLVFFANGAYFQWCNDVGCEAAASGQQEVGNYLYEDGVLTISAVSIDGPGGFEQDVTAVTTVSADQQNLTLDYYEQGITQPVESVAFRRVQ